MSLTEYANEDTPKRVEVPPSWVGLAMWMLGRWGAGALFAAACVFVYQDFRAESNRVYADNKAASERLLDAYKDQTKVNAEVAASLRQLSEAVGRTVAAGEEALRNAKRLDALERKTP